MGGFRVLRVRLVFSLGGTPAAAMDAPSFPAAVFLGTVDAFSPLKLDKAQVIFPRKHLGYTILQPAVLMQNLQLVLEQVRLEGVWNQKFFTDKDTRLCMVDLNDVAEAAARIAQERERHTGATYELCGPENLRMNDIRRILETRYHREIVVHYTPDEVILNGLKKFGAVTLYSPACWEESRIRWQNTWSGKVNHWVQND